MLYGVKVGLERRSERLKTNQDKVTKVTMWILFPQAASLSQNISFGLLSPLATDNTSKGLARGTPGESTASDQGILTLSELSPEIPPFRRLNVVWAKVHAQILTRLKRGIAYTRPNFNFYCSFLIPEKELCWQKAVFALEIFCCSQSKLFWDCIYAL